LHGQWPDPSFSSNGFDEGCANLIRFSLCGFPVVCITGIKKPDARPVRCVRAAIFFGQLDGAENDPSRSISERLVPVFNIAAPLPRFEPDRLALFNKGEHDMVQVIPQLNAWIDRVKRDGGATVQLLEDVRVRIRQLQTQYEMFKSTLIHSRNAARHSRGQTSEMFEMARRYCVLHAAAASVLLWAESRHVLGEFFARGEWLEPALGRLLGLLKPDWDIAPARYGEAVWAELVERFHNRTLFSVVPLRLAGRAAATRSASD
jgi:hypothetical protein